MAPAANYILPSHFEGNLVFHRRGISTSTFFQVLWRNPYQKKKKKKSSVEEPIHVIVTRVISKGTRDPRVEC